MIAHFLTAGRSFAHNGAASELQVRATVECMPRHKEYFLFKADVVNEAVYLVPKQLEKTRSFFGHGFHRTMQRSFLVQCISIVGYKSSWYEYSVFS
mmetsp:Transcript_9177/g.25583  ORF Transcript_9177/g.25583 Transcript_9177/m.25583 type:complete len:96 (-) Transcript_9177:705-992(-)